MEAPNSVSAAICFSLFTLMDRALLFAPAMNWTPKTILLLALTSACGSGPEHTTTEDPIGTCYAYDSVWLELSDEGDAIEEQEYAEEEEDPDDIDFPSIGEEEVGG